jgi:hypothetical protein
MIACGLCLLGCLVSAVPVVLPPQVSAPAREGITLHVSKQGDNSDGSSWAKGFHSIQAALDAIPDDQGGHRILVRPDTYVEAMLSPAHAGAAGAYNELVGDFDGALGSGVSGWVIIDSGDPEKGFKSYDWWSTIRATAQGWSAAHTDPTFSAIIWDRWVLRRLYATGSDAGLFWDCTNRTEPFTVVVEDSVGIGRAFGGGVGNCLSRADEPMVFRRCLLWALDWWGDTAGAYVRVENPAMPERPDIYFEDCTMVSPQCALKGGNFGFKTFMRININRCRLIALNFSQPGGTPIDGIIQSVEHGKYLHVDLQDSTLMGYKVFGVRVNKETVNEIGFSTQGAVNAYVQFQQEVPKGFLRLGHWPIEVFANILPQGFPAAAPVPVADNPYSNRVGKTIYVSKLGDNTDGASWATAFRTIQTALDAVPDAEGGHRIVLRPDTYMEAMLKSPHPGAAGAYNSLIADFDGRLGSGTTGYAVIDSSDPKQGLKSVDWWGPFFCTAKESAKDWDRWALRHLYSTGSEGGLGWDLTADLGMPFSVIVEDSFGIGRAFGGIVGGHTARPGEPVIYRRCQLWSLDWWGDTAGMYVRSESPTLSSEPDVIMEDCTLASPQCALKAGNPGFAGFSRVALRNCRLIALNFSQPQGTPIPGVIQSVVDGKFLHVDLEDCTVMGYKVFGVREKTDTEKDIGFTTRGKVRAYVQFQQEVPEGFERLTQWPAETFQTMLPSAPPVAAPQATETAFVHRDMCEVSPVTWQGRPCLMYCLRPGSGGTKADYHLSLVDAASNEELARFAEGYSLACALEHDGVFYAFASRFEDANWNDVTMFKSADLKQWDQQVVIQQEPGEHLFNSSVCAGPDGFVMAYESNDPAYPAFTTKFATSKDLATWTKLDGVAFGKDRYTACPCIRYADGFYYVLYTEHRTPRWFFETWIARSTDLKTWALSPMNPVLRATEIDDGIDASDPDLTEINGQTSLYYAVGDQLTWMNIKRAQYAQPLDKFLAAWFAGGDGIPAK